MPSFRVWKAVGSKASILSTKVIGLAMHLGKIILAEYEGRAGSTETAAAAFICLVPP